MQIEAAESVMICDISGRIELMVFFSVRVFSSSAFSVKLEAVVLERDCV